MICSQRNKEFILSHHNQKYCSKECAKSKKNNIKINICNQIKGKKLIEEFKKNIINQIKVKVLKKNTDKQIKVKVL